VNKWFFIWDTPKAMPQLAFEVDTAVDLDHVFGSQPDPKAKAGNKTQPETPVETLEPSKQERKV
jgi:hypothetical protein